MMTALITPKVRLPRNVTQSFSYAVDDKFKSVIKVGSLCLIPFRARRVLGVVESIGAGEIDLKKIKQIEEVLTFEPFTESQQILATDLEISYGATRTQAIRVIVPDLPHRATEYKKNITVINRKKKTSNSKLLTHLLAEAGLTVVSGKPMPASDPIIAEYIRTKSYDGQVLCLFPDRYSLNRAALIYRSEYLLDPVVWQTNLPKKQTSSFWQTIATGNKQIIFGTRSALFLPFHHLSAVVVFEANDESHRSWDMQPHYDIRDMVPRLAGRLGIPCLLITIVPPLITSGEGRIIRVVQKEKAKIEILERRGLAAMKRSEVLHPDAVQFIKNEKGPILIFANKRGYAATVCRGCGFIPRCSTCDKPFVILTKLKSSTVTCRLCLTTSEIPEECPVCKSHDFAFIGAGIERIAESIKKIFSDRSLEVIEANRKQDESELSKKLEKIRNGKVDITITTSVILSRLWSLPRFSLTIVFGVNNLSFQHDWQSAERQFGILTTLRAATKNIFVVDSFDADDSCLLAIKNDSVADYFDQERLLRRQFHYPPYGTVVALTGPSSSIETLQETLENPSIISKTLIKNFGKNRFSRLVIKIAANQDLTKIWKRLPSDIKVDVNPVTLI